MNIQNIKSKLNNSEYRFLVENEHLNKNIMLLTLGGSYAYGMNKESSDIDLRGIAFNSKKEVLLGEDFDQVVDIDTDTTIYSFNKMIKLLASNNPNTLEILGCHPDHYIFKTRLGDMLIEKRHMFLSQLCIHTFGGYASSQLRRLENKSIRNAEQERREQHILKSIENASYEFKHRYLTCPEDSIKLFIDKSGREDFDSEIFMNINLEKYPLRDWANMWNEMKCIVSSYEKMGKRNSKAIEHDKLGKHMAHLIRLYFMCIDILEKEEIITYRTSEHELLMSIRNGDYLDNNDMPTSDFYDLLNEMEKRLDYAKENTSLRELPDIESINEFKIYVNELIVKGEV